MRSPAIQRRLEEILERASQAGSAKWPPISEGLLVHLEALFAPRCLGPQETVEDHLRYAGAAELVADLRYHFNQQQEPDSEETAVEVMLNEEEDSR